MPRDEDVANHFAYDLPYKIDDCWRDGDDGPFSANDFSNCFNQAPESKRFGADGVDDPVFPRRALLHRQPRQIVNIDGLKIVLSIAEYATDGQPAEQSGDIVDQDVLFPKKHRWTKNGVGKPGFL